MFLIEKASNNIGFRIASILNLDNDGKDIVCYGAFCVLQTFLSIFWILVVAVIFKVLLQAIIISFTVAFLRKYSGGVHATSPARCIIISTFVFSILSLIAKITFINVDIKLIVALGIAIFITCFYIVYKLAPADTESKPITKNDMIAILKRNSILFILLILLIDVTSFIFYFNTYNRLFLNIIVCTCIGIAWQSFTLTSIAYKRLSEIDLMIKNVQAKCIKL